MWLSTFLETRLSGKNQSELILAGPPIHHRLPRVHSKGTRERVALATFEGWWASFRRQILALTNGHVG